MAPPLKVPPHLPRELKDVILTHLIHHPSHTRNPAYQWTVLRHLTPYHRRQLELYFRTFWLPTLILTIYYRKSVSVDFRAERMHKDGRTVRFRAREGWDELMKEFGYGKEADVEICWTRRIWRGIAGGNLYEAAAGASGLRMVWRLGVGEGVLNGGLGGGWIVSDALVRGIRVGDGGEFIWVDWRAVFDEILGDEMRMRKWTETLLAGQVRYLAATKKWPVYPPKQRLLLLEHLRTDSQLRRRAILTAYHEHIFYGRPGPFTIPEALWLRKFKPTVPDHLGSTSPPTLMHIILEEESMVFSMPDWRALSLAEFAKLRAEETRWRFDSWNDQWGYRGTLDSWWPGNLGEIVECWEALSWRKKTQELAMDGTARREEEERWKETEREAIRDLKNCKRFGHGWVEGVYGMDLSCRKGALCRQCQESRVSPIDWQGSGNWY